MAGLQVISTGGAGHCSRAPRIDTRGNRNVTSRHPLIPLVEKLLAEAPNTMRLLELSKGLPVSRRGGSSPIDQACAAFARAVDRVAESADRVVAEDWQQRRRNLAQWLQVLRDNPPQESPPFEAIFKGDVALSDVIDDVIVGPRWRECLDQLADQQQWAAVIARETARKVEVFADSTGRVGQIIGRAKQRMRDIVLLAEPRIEAADPDERGSIIRSARDEVAIVSDTAVAQIHTQVRRVLDLDETTAAISLSDWLAES